MSLRVTPQGWEEVVGEIRREADVDIDVLRDMGERLGREGNEVGVGVWVEACTDVVNEETEVDVTGRVGQWGKGGQNVGVEAGGGEAGGYVEANGANVEVRKGFAEGSDGML